MIKLELEVSGLVEQISKLKSFKTIAERHMRRAGKDGVKLMATEWKKVAPVDSGRYKGAIKGRVKSVVGLDVLGIASANVKNHGYPYPRLLEFSPKHHYRGTGKGTKGQAQKAIDSTEKSIFKEIDKAMARVAKDLIFK